MVDPEAYFSRKKNYSFNLQAICNWEHWFIYHHILDRMHVIKDSLKKVSLYRHL